MVNVCGWMLVNWGRKTADELVWYVIHTLGRIKHLERGDEMTMTGGGFLLASHLLCLVVGVPKCGKAYFETGSHTVKRSCRREMKKRRVSEYECFE